MFQRIQNGKPELFKKIIPLQGDLSIENLGLSEEDHQLLINEVNFVYHFAATLRLEAKLKDAVEMNLVSSIIVNWTWLPCGMFDRSWNNRDLILS